MKDIIKDRFESFSVNLRCSSYSRYANKTITPSEEMPIKPLFSFSISVVEDI